MNAKIRDTNRNSRGNGNRLSLKYYNKKLSYKKFIDFLIEFLRLLHRVLKTINGRELSFCRKATNHLQTNNK